MYKSLRHLKNTIWSSLFWHNVTALFQRIKFCLFWNLFHILLLTGKTIRFSCIPFIVHRVRLLLNSWILSIIASHSIFMWTLIWITNVNLLSLNVLFHNIVCKCSTTFGVIIDCPDIVIPLICLIFKWAISLNFRFLYWKFIALSECRFSYFVIIFVFLIFHAFIFRASFATVA